MTRETFLKLKEIHTHANKVLNAEMLEWEEKFDLIFCESVSRVVFNLLKLDYSNPDTSDEEDVRAFMDAFNNKMNRFIESKIWE